MGFDTLKAKLAGKEDGYPVNDDTIQEWINMNADQKKELIAEAKEKGGVWRESLLKLNEAANTWSRGGAPSTPAGAAVKKETLITSRENTPEKIAARKAMNAEEEKLKLASKIQSGTNKAPDADTGSFLSKIPTEYKIGAPAALAAGLGAVALAKKMRAAKKK